jgi:excisionase family DNA binding protein
MIEHPGTDPGGDLQPPLIEPLLTLEEVADLLRVPVLTVRWLRQEGRFAPAVKVGRRLVWTRSDLAAWIAAQREVA